MTLKTLFLDRLAMIYDAETRLTEAMQNMATAATCDALHAAIVQHLHEKREHVASLQSIFATLGEKAWRKTSEVTVALLYESHDIIAHFKGFPVINAALIAAVQKIEHYEIASYGCLRDWATVLDYKGVAAALQCILDQDKATNDTLTALARTRSNQEALSDCVVKDSPITSTQSKKAPSRNHLGTQATRPEGALPKVATATADPCLGAI